MTFIVKVLQKISSIYFKNLIYVDFMLIYFVGMVFDRKLICSS